MPEYNPLLMRQLKKNNVDPDAVSDPGIKKLLALVSESYDANDEDRALLERSFEISSREYQDSINQIKTLQTQLIQNEKLAGIGQLSAGVAHEINNPLGFVQSNMDMLKKYIEKIYALYRMCTDCSHEVDSMTADDLRERVTELRKYIETARLNYIFSDLEDLMVETGDGLSRIEKIVKSLLGFTRKGLEDESSAYDLNKGIRETLTIANNELKYHASVEEEYSEIPAIQAFAGEINQVLLNLIVNAGHAVKAKEGKGRIRIRTFSDTDHVYCEISDNGIGIPEDIMGRIFDPFFTTKPVGVGTGLGLSIAHDIVTNKHQGDLTVASHAGSGTTFCLKLPICRDSRIADET